MTVHRVHKIDEYSFLNIKLKYYIPIIVEEQYATTSYQSCSRHGSPLHTIVRRYPAL